MLETGSPEASPAAPSGNEPVNVFSLANLPPWALADCPFQLAPRPLHIGRTRQDNKRLFALLAAEPNPARRGEIFHEYLTVQFSLHEWETQTASGRASLKNSYIRFLRGWAVDSNSIEGAVLKGWVHSRFGLEPTFHHENLAASSAARERYEIDRIRGQAKTNAIFQQLDLLYEFCQDELPRRHSGTTHLTLFRGTFDAGDYLCTGCPDPTCTLPCPLASQDGSPRKPARAFSVVRFNNISSFTADRECAWEFGSTVWEARVPLSKLFFFSGLLPTSLLRGEEEYLVIGGDYPARKLLW